MNEKPECTVEEMNKKIGRIEDTLYGSNGKDIVSRIISKIDAESLQGKLTTLIVIGFILITLAVVGILLQCIFQSQLPDVSELKEIL